MGGAVARSTAAASGLEHPLLALDRTLELGAARSRVHDLVGGLGEPLPVVEVEAEERERRLRRHRVREVEDEVDRSRLDARVDRRVRERRQLGVEPLDRGGREHRVQDAAERVPLRRVHLDERVLVRRLRDVHAAEPRAVVRGEVARRERRFVAHRLGEALVAGDDPEAVVVRGVRDRAPGAEIGGDLLRVRGVLRRRVVELDDHPLSGSVHGALRSRGRRRELAPGVLHRSDVRPFAPA